MNSESRVLATHCAPSVEALTLSRLAELMLPDGAHLRAEDWTVFYLGQTSHSGLSVSNTILNPDEIPEGHSETRAKRASMVAPADRPPRGVAGGGLLYVLNCVRMKEDKSMRRGAMVKAMAICSPYPYIGIYKVGHCSASTFALNMDMNRNTGECEETDE